MAKCSNCDYPYVPKYKSCPNCGDSGSDSGSNSTANSIILLLFFCIGGIVYLYEEFYCDGYMDDKWFNLNNSSIHFHIWEYSEEPDKRVYTRFNNIPEFTDKGEWKIENDSIFLYPDNAGNGKFEKYSVDDLKEDKEMND
jgi:hypothetical protein